MNLIKILKSVGKKDASKYSIEPCVLLRCKDTAQDSNGEEIKPAQDISKACGLSVYKVNPAYKPRASRCFADLLDDLEDEARVIFAEEYGYYCFENIRIVTKVDCYLDEGPGKPCYFGRLGRHGWYYGLDVEEDPYASHQEEVIASADGSSLTVSIGKKKEECHE